MATFLVVKFPGGNFPVTTIYYHTIIMQTTASQIFVMFGCMCQVVVFYSLRLLLAPVIETVLLLDRGIYLYEQGR